MGGAVDLSFLSFLCTKTVKSATQKLKKFDLNSDEEDFPSDPDAKDGEFHQFIKHIKDRKY